MHKFISTIIYISLPVLCLSGCEQAVETSTALYDSAPVENRTIDITVEAAGIIEPETTVEVKSKASGEILSINAETGDHVEEGTLLVQVDKRTPQNNVDQSQADLDAAIARRKIAVTQLSRTKNLLDKGIITDAEYETADLELANAEALVISRQVDLENARIALDDTDVKAPISGIIIEKNVERGQVISSPTQDVGGGTILLKMADLSTVQVRTLVDETDIGKIKPGMPVTVKVSAYPNQPFSGEVLKIEPQATVEENVTMFAVLIRLQNQSGLLRPGMNAEVNISIAHADSVTAVPTMALRTERDIVTTAAILGMTETDLRQKISDSEGNKDRNEVSAPIETPTTMTIGNREITIPPGVDAGLVRSAMEKRRNNQTPTDDERQAMQKVFQNGGNRDGRADFRTGNRNTMESSIDYQFGGSYWVLVMENGNPVVRTVKTGVTDHEYSEVVSGLQQNEQVLILPSSGLVERQEEMQNRLTQRMSFQRVGGNNQAGGPPGGR